MTLLWGAPAAREDCTARRMPPASPHHCTVSNLDAEIQSTYARLRAVGLIADVLLGGQIAPIEVRAWPMGRPELLEQAPIFVGYGDCPVEAASDVLAQRELSAEAQR